MSISLHRNKKRHLRKKLVSDINITPFVDVLLVLLIIFMIAAPMLTGSVKVDLPEGASKSLQENSTPIVLTINSDGKIFLEEEALKLSFINQKLYQITQNDRSKKIFVKADKKIDYGRVMDVIKTINQGGFQKVILVTELVQ